MVSVTSGSHLLKLPALVEVSKEWVHSLLLMNMGSLKYGLTENISVGAVVSYSSLKNTLSNNNVQKLTQFGAVLRGNYHFGSSDKFDPYIGIGVGYYNFKYTSKDANGNDVTSFYSVPGAFGYQGQLGAKYYFMPSLAAFAEIGYVAGSFGQIGVNFKF